MILLALYIVAMTPPGERLPGLGLEVAVCAAAALSTRWPLAGALATGGLLMVLSLVTDGEVRMSAFACLVPLVATGARGRWRLTLGLTLWYLVVLAYLEAPDGHPLNLVGAAWSWALVLCVALLLAVGLDRTRVQQQNANRAREAELMEQRRTIARELHDTISHTATLGLLRAATAKEHIEDPTLIAEDLDYLTKSFRQMTVDLRTLLTAIRAPVERPIDEGPSIAPSAAITRSRAQLERAGFQASILTDGPLDDLPSPARDALVKTVAEATQNIIRHGARGSGCSLLFERTGKGVEFVATNTVSDKPFEHSNGYGLTGLGERVRSVGGELNVSSIPPNWVLHACIPLPTSAEATAA